MYLTACRAAKINPQWVELIKSRGFESDDLKTFMRFTVLFSDVLIMISGSFLLSSKIPNFTKVPLYFLLGLKLIILVKFIGGLIDSGLFID